MLGITTHQLTFVTSNRPLYFRRDLGGFIFIFYQYTYQLSSPLIVRFAATNLSSYSTERRMAIAYLHITATFFDTHARLQQLRREQCHAEGQPGILAIRLFCEALF